MLTAFNLIVLSLIALWVGTGAYVLYPKSVYIVFVLALVLVTTNINYIKKGGFFNFKKIVVFLLYVFFIFLFSTREDDQDIYRRYSTFFLAFVGYILVGFLLFLNKKNNLLLTVIPMISIAIIGIGLFLDMHGVINMRVVEIATGVIEKSEFETALVNRPGGFTNANMTAALSLVWLFVALERSPANAWAWLFKILSSIGSAAVCLITQSRGAVLFGLIYAGYKIISLKLNKYYWLSAAVIASVIYFCKDTPIVQNLLDRFIERAHGDSSSDSRINLLKEAVDLFQANPILGHGLRYMERSGPHSSHNQILEVLVNFGVVGLLIFLALYLVYYHKNSFSYLCLCVFPTLVFSHNFFDTTSFQVALSFAYHSIAFGRTKGEVIFQKSKK